MTISRSSVPRQIKPGLNRPGKVVISTMHPKKGPAKKPGKRAPKPPRY